MRNENNQKVGREILKRNSYVYEDRLGYAEWIIQNGRYKIVVTEQNNDFHFEVYQDNRHTPFVCVDVDSNAEYYDFCSAIEKIIASLKTCWLS